ncbi:MAG TPA: acetyltransferase [Anaerolineae bacterium]|nr:acetyltransferase [Anaerolineae bacterium]
MKSTVILGAGGFAREVLDILLAQNGVSKQHEILGFIDENPAMKGRILNGYPVLGAFDWFASKDQGAIHAVCGIGSPVQRKKVVTEAGEMGLRFCNVIHPTAVLTPFVSLGVGVVITAGTILTNQIVIGSHVHINLGATIGHDCVIEQFCTIAPGVHLSGNVKLGIGVDVGTGAVIIQGCSIGNWTVIGAGAAVIEDLPDHVTAVGVPARVVKDRRP